MQIKQMMFLNILIKNLQIIYACFSFVVGFYSSAIYNCNDGGSGGSSHNKYIRQANNIFLASFCSRSPVK